MLRYSGLIYARDYRLACFLGGHVRGECSLHRRAGVMRHTIGADWSPPRRGAGYRPCDGPATTPRFVDLALDIPLSRGRHRVFATDARNPCHFGVAARPRLDAGPWLCDRGHLHLGHKLPFAIPDLVRGTRCCRRDHSGQEDADEDCAFPGPMLISASFRVHCIRQTPPPAFRWHSSTSVRRSARLWLGPRAACQNAPRYRGDEVPEGALT